MANTSSHLTRDFLDPHEVMARYDLPVQAAQTLYQGAGITRDTSGNVGTFTAGERLVGFGHPDITHKDFSSATAAQTGKDVPITPYCWLALTVSGAASGDEGKAVFMTDDQTFSYTPTAGMYVGRVVLYDTRNSELIVAANNIGISQWTTWTSLADDAELGLPAQIGVAMAQAGAEALMVTCLAAGAVVLMSTDTGNTAVADTDAKLCIYDAGSNASVKNRLGSTQRVQITWWGVEI